MASAMEDQRLQTLSAGFALAMLTATHAVSLMDRVALSVLALPIKAEFHLTDTAIGLATGPAFALFYVGMGLPLARLADRYSRRLVIAVGIIAWSALTAACGLAGSFPQLLLARFGVGAGEAGCVPAGHSMLADQYEERTRPLAIAIFHTGAVIGTVLGLALAGTLVGTVGWRGVLLTFALPGAVLGFVWILLGREPKRGRFDTRRSDGDAPPRSRLKMLLRDRRFQCLVMASTASNFALYSLSQWAPSFYVRVHTLPLASIGPAFGLAFGLGSALGLLAGGVAGRWLSRPTLLGLSALFTLLGAPVLLVALWAPWWISIAAMFVATALLLFSTGPIVSNIQALCDPPLRAIASATLLVVTSLFAVGGAPFLVGFLSDQIAEICGAQSLRWALLVTIPASLAGAAFLTAASANARTTAQGS